MLVRHRYFMNVTLFSLCMTFNENLCRLKRETRSDRRLYRAVFRTKVISGRHVREHCIIPDPQRPGESR